MEDSFSKLFKTPFGAFLATFSVACVFFFVVALFANSFEKNATKDVLLTYFGVSFLFGVYIAMALYLESDEIKNSVPKFFRRLMFVCFAFFLLFLSFNYLPRLN